MDVNTLKGRIAEAFVEGILRRAGYQVALVGRESRIQHLLKIGRDQFLPDFLVWKPVDDSSSSWPPCRLAGIEVKYRHDIGAYLRRDFASESVKIAAQWPELYFVLVTDQPEPGRSCFQAIRPQAATQDPSTPTVDLHHVVELDIHKRNVEEHERLATRILPLLGSNARELPRKPVAKAPAPPASPLLRVAR
jgi:hypothetical protein